LTKTAETYNRKNRTSQTRGSKTNLRAFHSSFKTPTFTLGHYLKGTKRNQLASH